MNVPENELVYIDSMNENETKYAMKNSTDSNFKNVEMISETTWYKNVSLDVNNKCFDVNLKLDTGAEVNILPLCMFKGGDEDSHDAIISRVLERAKFLNIKFNPDKLQYRVSEVKYVGPIISKSGIKPDPDHIKAIVEMPTPKSKTEVRLLWLPRPTGQGTKKHVVRSTVAHVRPRTS
ncbi:retrovirus-related Pol polyprotein from transposon 17.6 [Trichonephila clavipes]|nr:retrovirus-related Pol polyprotein from transposon 17.6 [Trichonephila clavipes]